MRRDVLNDAGSSLRFDAVVILATLAMSVVVILGIASQIRYEREQALRQLAITNQSRVGAFEEYVVRTLEFASVVAGSAQKATTNADLARLDHGGPGDSPFSGVFRVDGRQIWSSRPNVRLTAAQRARLSEMATGSPYPVWVSPPMPVRGITGETLAVVSRANKGEPFGVVLLAPTKFTQFADEFQFEQDDLISLIGLDGVTRVRRTGPKISGGEPVKGLVMERQRAFPNGNYIGPSVIDGKVRYFTHRRLPNYGLFVTSGRPIHLVATRIANRKFTLLFFLILALVTIIAAALAAIAYRRRRQKELFQLVESNRRLREAQRIGKIGDWNLRLSDQALFWSDELVRMYGRTPGQTISHVDDAMRYVRDQDAPIIQECIERVTSKGETATWDVEVRLENGEESYRRVNAAPVLDGNGTVVGIQGTDQDITAEVRVRKLEARLAELARLDAMNVLAATLAHELNQPLGVAMNYIGASLARATVSGDSQLEKFLRAADGQLDHLSQIVTSARDLVVHAGNSVEVVDFEGLFLSTQQLLRGSDVKRRIVFAHAVADNVPQVMANSAQIKQVLFNLGRNAVESVPVTRRPLITFRALSDCGYARIEVEDNGEGFAEFTEDPFAAMTTSKAAGLGLGLSLARTIVEGHGGRIWIDRTDSSGTILAFTLEAAKNG